MLRGSKRVLIASALLLYFGGATVLSQHDLSGLAQLVSAIAGIAGTVLRQPRFAQVAGGAAAVSLLIILGPTALAFLSGRPVPADSLFVGLLVVLVIPPLVMLWGAFAMSRTQPVRVARFLDLEPEQRASPQARRSGPNRLGRGSHPGWSTGLPSATTVDSTADVHGKRAGLVVAVAGSIAGAALSIEPRNVPVLLASVVALLYGLWLLLGGRATAGRTWGVLVAGGIGGVLGFLPLIDLFSRRGDRGDIVAEYLSIAGHVGPYAAASGLLFGLMWPEWWWRWGLILSWGFVVASFAAEGALSRAVPLLLVPIPCLAAAAGALIRRVVPMLSNR